MQTFELYNGEVRISFDPGKHVYFVEDTRDPMKGVAPVESVTTVTSVIDKSGPLLWWAVNDMALPYIFGGGKRVKFEPQIIPGGDYDEIQLLNIRKGASMAHRTQKESAADIGTLVHNWCEKWIKADMIRANEKD